MEVKTIILSDGPLSGELIQVEAHVKEYKFVENINPTKIDQAMQIREGVYRKSPHKAGEVEIFIFEQWKLKTSKEWAEDCRDFVTILDPDGWDRQNYDFSFNQELITKEEFKERITYSTVKADIEKLLTW